VTRTRAYALVATAALVPRVIVLAVERGDILTRFAEKSDDFAQTFVSSGTYGFVPGEPSAYTQPLYGFFLVPLYWIFGRHWPVVGLAQALVSVATALLVFEIGRRLADARLGLVGAVVATLNPYLVWHDVHVNREVVDQVVAAALVLCVLVAAERRSVAWSAAAGLAAGLGILGNTRLVFLPLVLALYLVWRRVPWQGAVALLVVAAVAVAGCGGDSVPSDAVAKVGDTSIKKTDFQHWLTAAARQQAQTTGSLPWLNEQSRPSRRIELRLRAGVACLTVAIAFTPQK
jgi:4-amino-4-deoxy-L-arabinose transferase-like glycosyltransferase